VTLKRALPMEAPEAPAVLCPLNHKHRWMSTKPVYIGDIIVNIYTQTHHQPQLTDAVFLFSNSTDTEWNAQDCGISKAAKDRSICFQKSFR